MAHVGDDGEATRALPGDQSENLEIAPNEDKMPPQDKESQLPPEGGVAGWLCILGSALAIFCTFGFLNAIGVFQTMYQSTILVHYDPSTISWIFAVQLCLMWLPGPIFGRLVDAYGPRPIMIPCSILCVFSLCMTSLSKEYYQIFLSQGLGFGIGAGGIFTVTVVCAGQWFVRRRGLAIGIAVCGSSLGGVIFPIFLDHLIVEVGFYGAVRYTALFIGILLASACVLVKARLPRKKWDNNLKWFDINLFRDKVFLLFTIGAFLVMWGLWAPFDYLSSMAKSIGFSDTLSLYLISIVNAGSIPGRILPGYLADKFGFFNTITIFSFIASISIICLWLPFDYHPSHAGIIIFALVYGFVSGAFVSLLMPCVARSGTLETLGQRWGTFQAIISVACLTGLPILGAILNTQGGSYVGMQSFAGGSMIIGSIFIGGSRVINGA